MEILHNTETWFGSDKGFIDYFEQEFKNNKLGTLKFPATHVNRFTDSSTGIFNKEKAAASIANDYINAIHRYKYKQLSRLKFDWLVQGGTQNMLRDAVCEAVQHAITNRNIFEIVNASSVSTPSFSMNRDTPGWLLSADMMGKSGWTNLQISNIEKYKVVTEDVLATETANGNTIIIGRLSDEYDKYIKELN